LFIAGAALNNVRGDNTYTVAVTIQGLPSDLATPIYVDGQINGTLNGGATTVLTLSPITNPSTHTITVESYVYSQTGNATRYYEGDTSWTVSGPGSHIFAYLTQYLLSVQTAYSTASGGGWYGSGTLANTTITSAEVNETQGVRNIFSGWGGDATGAQSTSNSIIMDGPKTAVANWKTQFLLVVESDPPNVSNLSGTGWYDAGSQINFSAPPIVPATSDTRLKFNHWSGEYNGLSPNGLIVMDRPKTETAIYGAQYLLTVNFLPPSITTSYNETRAGWYDAGANVQLGPAPSIINLSNVERLEFTGWAENTSQSMSPSYTVTMNIPRVVTLSYKTQYYVDVQSTYGSVTGAGWYDRGSTAIITASTTSGTWPIPYVLAGWTVNPSTGTLIKTDSGWNLTVNGPYVIQAQWNVDYVPILELFGGLGVSITAVLVAVAVAYRRGALTRGSHPRKMESGQAMGATVICHNCGNIVPKAATFCEKCGAPMITQTPAPLPSPDDRVYDYILKNEGTISLSEASAQLGIPVGQLKEITERLKKQGRLG
jgi:hypothetical protein